MAYQKVIDWKKLPELARLKVLTAPPKNLYFIGLWTPAIFTDCVAVVGSRRMTQYGRTVIEKIIPQLVFQGKTVISGFMYGVDQYAHQICAESGGKTIAVLGWGINIKLEDFNLKLAHKIIQTGGILLSEWKEQQPSLWTFPARNRIVAALSHEVIIIEAGVKSGSLITARIASKLKRKIWAVPGPITSRYSFGTNSLIAQGKAKMWRENSSPQTTSSHNSDPILNILENNALTTSEIARLLNQPVSQIGAALSLLVLSDKLTEKEGKYYLKYAG